MGGLGGFVSHEGRLEQRSGPANVAPGTPPFRSRPMGDEIDPAEGKPGQSFDMSVQPNDRNAGEQSPARDGQKLADKPSEQQGGKPGAQPSSKPGEQAGKNGYVANPFLDNSLGRRTPVVVGTSAPGVGNYTNNLGIPFTQGSATQIQPFNQNRKSEAPAKKKTGAGDQEAERLAGRSVEAKKSSELSAKAKEEAFLNEMQDADLAMGIPNDANRNGVSYPKNFKEIVERRRKMLEDQANGGDAFARIVDNPFLPVEANPLSTFSIDVDTASYANVRRYLNSEHTSAGSIRVRIEELVNYFPYTPIPSSNGRRPVLRQPRGRPLPVELGEPAGADRPEGTRD